MRVVMFFGVMDGVLMGKVLVCSCDNDGGLFVWFDNFFWDWGRYLVIGFVLFELKIIMGKVYIGR